MEDTVAQLACLGILMENRKDGCLSFRRKPVWNEGNKRRYPKKTEEEEEAETHTEEDEEDVQ